MRIACIGNMNNGLFPLYRYLKDRGYEIDLFRLPQEPEHFAPKADSFQHDEIEFPILDWHYENWLTYPTNILQAFTAQYDFFIVQGIAPAYLYKAGCKVDLFIPYGGDMYRVPHWSKIRKNNGLKSDIKRWFFARAQKKGIQLAKHIVMERTNDFFEAFLNQLTPKGKRHPFALPHLYIPQYVNYEQQFGPRSIHLNTFKSIKQKFPFIVFQHARQMWKDIPNQTYSKGNDLLIKGFVKFCIQYSDAALVLYEYGNDVANSKILVHELGIAERVFWMPLMPRKEIMMGIAMANVVVGELTHSYFSYGIVHESLAAGVPLMHRRDDHLYSQYYPELYPMVHASSAETVMQGLTDIYTNPTHFQHQGKVGRDWLFKYGIGESIDKIEGLINS